MPVHKSALGGLLVGFQLGVLFMQPEDQEVRILLHFIDIYFTMGGVK